MAEREPLFRRFELTIGVYVGRSGELPTTFAEWRDIAFGTEGLELPATPTTLERVVEVRYPVAEDIRERRQLQRSSRTKDLY